MNNRIFKFNDGESDVFVDPSEIDFQLDSLKVAEIMFPERVQMIPTKEDGTLDIDKADPIDLRLAEECAHEVEPLIRKAFGLEPFDRATGKGMLYAEVMGLYGSYLDWREATKKNSQEQPSSVPPTA